MSTRTSGLPFNVSYDIGSSVLEVLNAKLFSCPVTVNGTQTQGKTDKRQNGPEDSKWKALISRRVFTQKLVLSRSKARILSQKEVGRTIRALRE
jgi:hypothetical protein